MSGIAALFARGGAPADAALLADLVAAQRFRGPDGQGSWLRGSVGLGHTLHRTTVEAAREVSPTILEDRLFITADARIDARDELAARLRDHGRALPAAAPDPELILHAYDAWGENCLRYLLGDFTFALWDAPRRKLLCAVDALGTRAFYYADRGGLFVGANSLAPVRLHRGVRDELDERAVGDFILAGHYQDRDITIYADVARIPPGHFLVVSDDGTRLKRHFTWPAPGEARWARPQDCVDQFQELLGRAVRDRLRTDKVAITMSGGVDSPLVAATARRALRERFAAPELRAYCAVYERLIPDDERRWAALAAASLEIPIDFQTLDDGQLFDWAGRVAPPEPTADSFVAPHLDQLARLENHSRVVLTGYDGDALFSTAFALHWRERLTRGRLATLARELAFYAVTRRSLPPMGLRTRLARRRAGATLRRPGWLREEPWRRADLEARWSRALLPPRPTRAREQAALRFAAPHWGAFFDAHDPAYLGRAIDFRHPLCDLRIILFALALPAIPWCVDKHLLRLCLGDLPASIRRRPKTLMVRDPFAELVRLRRLGSVRAARLPARLERFLDLAAVRQALGRLSEVGVEKDDDPWPLLRAAALGLWLENRDTTRGRASASALVT